VLAVLFGIFLLGWAAGAPLEMLLAGVVCYLGWHLFSLWRLTRWLGKGRTTAPPETFGLWRLLHQEIYKLQRQRRQRKLRLSSIIARFREAASAMPDAIVVLRANDEIDWINPAATGLLGLRYPQDGGQPISNLVRSPSLAAFLARGRFDDPFELRSPVNEWLLLSVRVVPYGYGQRLLIARDLTRLYRLEEMRQEFVANVSHELRSPLTVLRGYLETLSGDETCPPDWRLPVEHMNEQTARMCNILEDLLELSRLDSNPGAAVRTPIALPDLLETIRSDALGLNLSGHRIVLEVDPDAGLLGDFNDLHSAFSNLVYNAVNYSPDQGLITVRWTPRGTGAVLEVQDQGVGIEPHHIPRLTERFYRVDKARSREHGGTGLGLAIVKHVLLQHDGRLKITSEPGRGSRFICVFPAARTYKITTGQETSIAKPRQANGPVNDPETANPLPGQRRPTLAAEINHE